MPKKLSLKELIDKVKRKTGFGWRTLSEELENHNCFCSWRSLHRWGTGQTTPFSGLKRMATKGLEAILEALKATAGKK